MDDRSDLFRRFLAVNEPAVPRPGQAPALALAWPDGAKVRRLRVRVQTDVFGPWVEVPAPVEHPDRPPARVALPAQERPSPVSYRVNVELEDGRKAELWGYFQVREAPNQPPRPARPTPDLRSENGATGDGPRTR